MNPQQPDLCGPEDTALGTTLFTVLALLPLSIGGPFAIAASALALAMLINDRSQSGTAPITQTPHKPGPQKMLNPSPVVTTPRYAGKSPANASPIAETLPIASLLNCPYVTIIGGSRSGKTTLATAISMLRKRRGDRINYATTDNDIPTEVRWDSVAIGAEPYGVAVDSLVEAMDLAGVAELRGHAYQFDELLAAAAAGVELTALIKTLLTRGPKTGVTVTIVTHADTISAHGLGSGLSESINRDRVLIEAIRDRLPTGEYRPSGRYRVTFPDEAPTYWAWPQWATEFRGGPLAALAWELQNQTNPPTN